MLVLGISGMFGTPEDEFIPGVARNNFHDSVPTASVRNLIARRLGEALGADLDPGIVEFFGHHRCHAASTYYQSGFGEALLFEQQVLASYRSLP